MTDSTNVTGINDSIRQRVLGDGYAAWKFEPDFDGLDHYYRTIPAACTKGTTLSIQNVERMFRSDFGITSVIVSKHDKDYLGITLFADNGDALKQRGWGKNDMGTLQPVATASAASFTAAVTASRPNELPAGVVSLMDRIEARRATPVRPMPRGH